MRNTLKTDTEDIRIERTDVLNPWLDHADQLMNVLEGREPKEGVLGFMTREQISVLESWCYDLGGGMPEPEIVDQQRWLVRVPVRRREAPDNAAPTTLHMEFARDGDAWKLASLSIHMGESTDK